MCAGSVSAAANAGGAARCRSDTPAPRSTCARPRTARRRARAHRPRASRTGDMDALSDDDDYARREPQVRCVPNTCVFNPRAFGEDSRTHKPDPHHVDTWSATSNNGPQRGVETKIACKDDLDRSLAPRPGQRRHTNHLLKGD
ncbi:unnamed protein product [Arctia plantaginis]|uniref:Uncharacterized protein n=1 Tax=Arctia plantaginis TaxID=874455 RepID=A0A8S1A3N6_ARCPL|nr:unnamed protein product [Arctia plantaginis]